MKKFELTAEYVTNLFGKKLFRIKALVAFGDVKEGDLGGFVEKESNLANSGKAWVCGDAQVSGNAQVSGDARVSGNAQVYGSAKVYGNAYVSDCAWVCGDARVSGDAWVCGNAKVYDDACVYDDAYVYGGAWVYGNARVSGDARVFGDARISGDARVSCDLDYAIVGGFGSEQRTSTFFIRKDGAIGVICGCFCGTIDEFRAKVKKTHKDSKYAQEYLMIADLMELHFAGGKDDER